MLLAQGIVRKEVERRKSPFPSLLGLYIGTMAGALITSILQASSLIPSLSQTLTNGMFTKTQSNTGGIPDSGLFALGLSLLGTLDAEILPAFITSQVCTYNCQPCIVLFL